MGRLVDLDKARELFHVAESCDKCQRSNIDCDSERVSYYTPRDICGLLDEVEEVDAVPVVRCYECKYYYDEKGACALRDDPDADEEDEDRVYVDLDFFCADGERRCDV